jgi:Ca2+-dependent lipid-binding protein
VYILELASSTASTRTGFKARFSPFLAGGLRVHLSDGQGLPNEELGKSDPYVVFYFDGEKRNTRVQSKTHTSGGQNPVWEQDFQLVLLCIMNFYSSGS